MSEFDLDLGKVADEARAAAYDMNNLINTVRGFSREHAIRGMVIDLKDARKMLRASGDNVLTLKAALTGAGATARDVRLTVGTLNRELDETRRKALGIGGTFKNLWSTAPITAYLSSLRAVNMGFSAVKKIGGGAANLLGRGVSGLLGKGIDTANDLADTLLHAATYRQNTITSLQHQYGGGDSGKAHAEETYAYAQKFAQKTPLETEQVIDMISELKTQKFTDDKEMKFIARHLADMSAIHANDTDELRKATALFGNVKGQGHASAGFLREALAANYSESNVIDSLLEQPGFKQLMEGKNKFNPNDTKELLHKKVKSTLSVGKVSSETFMNALIGSEHRGGSLDDVGKFAEKAGIESLTGALSNAKSAFKDLVGSIDLAGSEGGKELAKFLNRVTDLTIGSKSLKSTLTGLWDETLMGLRNIRDTDITSMIDTVARMGRTAIGFIKEAWEWLNKLIHAEPGEFLSNVKDMLVDVGAYIGSGIMQGVKSGLTGINERKAERKYGVGGMADLFDYQAKLGGGKTEDYANAFASAHDAFRKSGGQVEMRYGESPQDALYRSVTDYGKTQMLKQALDTGMGTVRGLLGGMPPIGDAARGGGTTPGLSYGPGGGDKQSVTLDLPSHADGLMNVPGPVGAPYAAVIHGGERIVPASQNRPSTGSMPGPGGGQVVINLGGVNLVMNGITHADADALESALEPVAMRAFRNSWDRLAMERGGA